MRVPGAQTAEHVGGAHPVIDPPVHTTVLANGLTVTTVDLPHLHTLSAALFWKVGSRFEMPETNGLSHFVEHMLFRGTDKHPNSRAIVEAAEIFGSEIEAETGPDLTVLRADFLPVHLPLALVLLAQISIYPRFEDIELERALVLAELGGDFEDGVEMVAGDIARGLLFKGHPLGQRIIGPRKNIRRFTTKDVRRHYKAFYGAANACLCVAGPINHHATVSWANDLFLKMQRGRRAECLPVAPAPPRKMFAKKHVTTPGSDNVEVVMAIRGVAEYDRRFPAQLVLRHLLDKALHYQLADQKGILYSIHVDMEPLADTSVLDITTEVAAKDVPYLIHSIAAAMKCENRVLERVRARTNAAVAAALDSPHAMVERFGGSALYIDPIPLSARVEQMARVSASDVYALACDLMVPERIAVVCVGGRKGLEIPTSETWP
jgi:predicted Zn-dependent peptidase